MAPAKDDRLVTSGTADLDPVIAPDPLDLRVSLASLVHWADSHDVRRRTMLAAEFPIDDMPMFLVVNQLSYRGAMRPSELASALGTGRANLTKIAHRLSGAGLIERVPAPGDERSVLLALSPTGRAAGERIMAYNQTVLDASLAHWRAEDRLALSQTLARLALETSPFLRPALYAG